MLTFPISVYWLGEMVTGSVEINEQMSKVCIIKVSSPALCHLK